MRRVAITFAISVFLSLWTCVGVADSPWRIENEMYKPNGAASGYVCWYENANHGDEVVAIWKSVSLKTGEIKELEGAVGYVIQKDSDEYPGALVAVETEDELMILHVDEDIQVEAVYTGEAIRPFEDRGKQTVRAYMGGTLYYIDTNQTSDSTFCQMSAQKADGSVYQYALSALEEGNGRFNKSLIDGYAIRPDGVLAWTDTENSNCIQIEIPNDSQTCVVDIQKLQDVDSNIISIERKGLGWMDDGSLCFIVVASVSEERTEYRLMNWDGAKITPVMDDNGENIVLNRAVESGSGLYFSPDGSYAAYFASPDGGFSMDVSDQTNYDLPVLLDLRTGKSTFLYEHKQRGNQDGREFRATRGQLTWCAPS